MTDLIGYLSLFFAIVGAVCLGYIGIRYCVYLWHTLGEDDEYWRF